MKTSLKYLTIIGFMLAAVFILSPEMLMAQRMGHSRGGGGGSMNRSATMSRPAPSTQNRSINGGSSRPAPNRPTTNQSENFPGNNDRSGINNSNSATRNISGANNRS